MPYYLLVYGYDGKPDLPPILNTIILKVFSWSIAIFATATTSSILLLPDSSNQFNYQNSGLVR